MILRRIARPMLAAVFVSGGIDTLRNPKPRVQTAEPVIDKAVGQVADKVNQVKDRVPEQVRDKLPAQVPTDAETLVKVNAAAQVGAGIALAFGRFPRLSALVLASSVVPTTVAGHRFWEYETGMERSQHQTQFFKNLGLLGGLLLAVADTHGKPSLSWRARRAARTAAGSVQDAANSILPK
jgi:uncharacterized membrane protein YphA (DoxX/SURF4 family)